MTDFSKKTGDYRSLSAVDIRLMALTYQLEKEHVGTGHIKTEPEKKVILKDQNNCDICVKLLGNTSNRSSSIKIIWVLHILMKCMYKMKRFHCMLQG